MHFACAKRGLDEVHFGGAFSPARRVDFRKSGNVQNVRVLRGVQNRRKGCSKLEVVKNVHFSWQAQYLVLLKSVLICSRCSFRGTVVEFGSAMLTSFSRGSYRTSYASDSTSRCAWNPDFLSLAVARCRFHVCKCNPLGTLRVSDRSGCRAVLILLMECRWRSAWGIFCFGSRNPLRSSRVSDRSRCSAVPILISSAQPSRYFVGC